MRVFLLILLVGATLLKVAATEEAVTAAEEQTKVEETKEGEEEVKKVIVEVERPERVFKKKEKEDERLVTPIERDEEGEVPIIMTSTGKVSGIRERSTEGKPFFSYYSIPYAKPPVGELRFKVSHVTCTVTRYTNLSSLHLFI